jgi:dihydroneopterin aldolase
MGWIALENMQFHAYHGVYEAEQAIGNDYRVDVFIKTQIGKSDALEDTINYEFVYDICALEMDKPRQLLESVLFSILSGLKRQFANMEAVRIKVQKMNPPVGGRVGSASVEEEFDLTSKCARCKSTYTCYHDEECWCHTINVLPATRETIQRQFGKSCLCENCMKMYAG